jgi:hypothetical protein
MSNEPQMRHVHKKKARRRMMLRIIKQEMGCIDCGYDADPVALQFDHVKGIKLFNIAESSSMTGGIKRLQTELAKCVVRCANCHAIRTQERRETSSVLG